MIVHTLLFIFCSGVNKMPQRRIDWYFPRQSLHLLHQEPHFWISHIFCAAAFISSPGWFVSAPLISIRKV